MQIQLNCMNIFSAIKSTHPTCIRMFEARELAQEIWNSVMEKTWWIKLRVRNIIRELDVRLWTSCWRIYHKMYAFCGRIFTHLKDSPDIPFSMWSMLISFHSLYSTACLPAAHRTHFNGTKTKTKTKIAKTFANPIPFARADNKTAHERFYFILFFNFTLKNKLSLIIWLAHLRLRWNRMENGRKPCSKKNSFNEVWH